MYEILFLCLGMIIGSFLNVCIFRIPKGESISFPPSHCMKCGTPIKAYDLIPVLSYIILGGRCRKCRDKISIRYPLIELTTGIIYMVLYIEYGLSLMLFKYIVLCSVLIVIGMIDFDTTDVYQAVTYFGVGTGILFLIAGFFLKMNVLDFLIGGFIAWVIIFIIYKTTGGMGDGDAEICLIGGLFLGWKLSLLMLFLSFVFGGIVGIILIAAKLKSRKDKIPFGPYITFAAIVCTIWGTRIIDWYLGLLY